MADTQTIKDRLDIVQLIQEYVELKKSGVNWKGCCPFHQEKTPSFMVHPERQFFHCFGCQKSGDIFTFIQEIEGLEFVEALKLLADRAGVKVDNFKSDINKSQKNRILEVNQKAAYFFHHFLLEVGAAKKAKDYLNDRGMKDKTIQDWQVGYISDQWDLLLKYLLKKGCGIEDIVASGLAIKKDNANQATGRGYYDRFRGRIMFPIWNVHGDVVGFTGRILIETENSGGKYVNTPQTLVFDKSRLVFGLNKAKQEIRTQDRAILVEGQMDVIACHQVGMTNVVAASGTALTLEHIKLIKRYTNNISIAFDADEAGLKAAKRGIDIALQEGMNIKIIQLPEGVGKDADECIKKSVQTWLDTVANAMDVMDWYFSVNLGNNIDLNNPKDKQKAAENILQEIVKIPYAIEREHWIQKLSTELNTSLEALKEESARILKNNQKYINQPKTDKSEVGGSESKNKSRYVLDLDNLFTLLIKQPNLYLKYKDELNDSFFRDTSLKTVYENFKKLYNNNEEIKVEKIEKNLDQEQKSDFYRLLMQSEEYYSSLSAKDIERMFKTVLNRVRENFKKQNIRNLTN